MLACKSMRLSVLENVIVVNVKIMFVGSLPSRHSEYKHSSSDAYHFPDRLVPAAWRNVFEHIDGHNDIPALIGKRQRVSRGLNPVCVFVFGRIKSRIHSRGTTAKVSANRNGACANLQNPSSLYYFMSNESRH